MLFSRKSCARVAQEGMINRVLLTARYAGNAQNKLPQPGSKVASFEYESSTQSKLPQPRKSKLFNTEVAHEANFSSPSAKVATFQFQVSTRSASAAPTHKPCGSTRGDLVGACPETGWEVHGLSRNFRGPYAKHLLA